MLSPDIQNDFLEAAPSLLLHKIKQELHQTPNTYYEFLAMNAKMFQNG